MANFSIDVSTSLEHKRRPLPFVIRDVTGTEIEVVGDEAPTPLGQIGVGPEADSKEYEITRPRSAAYHSGILASTVAIIVLVIITVLIMKL